MLPSGSQRLPIHNNGVHCYFIRFRGIVTDETDPVIEYLQTIRLELLIQKISIWFLCY